jgi:hypothetical protein
MRLSVEACEGLDMKMYGDDSGAEGVGDEGLAVEIVGGVEGFIAGFFFGWDGGV